MPNELTATPRGTDTPVSQIQHVIRRAADLKTILDASLAIEPKLDPDSVAREVSAKTGIEYSEVRSILIALDNLNDLKSDNGSAEAAIDSVIRTFGKEQFPGLEDAKSKIVTAIDGYPIDNPVAISFKASRLAYLFEKLFVGAEIITDARPVYNAAGTEIKEFVISHCIVMTYHEDSAVGSRHNHPRVHIALDSNDILALKDVCDRALVKENTLSAELGKKARVLGNDG